jgi:caffeoyl-CoA O-methyltransferase
MDFLPKPVDEYCSQYTTAENELLKQLNRDTHAHVLQPRMLSGHFQGRLLSMISHMIKPSYILEIGTYTGYSALCLAEGLAQNGKLITIDINPEQEERINRYAAAAGKSNQIQFIVGDAYNIIKTLPHSFDLIFIDADKPNYPKYYEQALEKLRPGGFILIDNVLWSGKVLDEQEREKDKDTKTLHALNAFIQQDNRVENILLPIRDGLMLVRKK